MPFACWPVRIVGAASYYNTLIPLVFFFFFSFLFNPTVSFPIDADACVKYGYLWRTGPLIDAAFKKV